MSFLGRAKSVARRSPRFMQFYRERDIPLSKGVFRFDPTKMEKVIEQNRALLSEFGDWVDPEAMKNSTFQYGLSPEWATAMHYPISRKMTYSDLLSYVASEAPGPVSYLEIGVSVGKNFWQVLNQVSNGQLVGLDIEDINPPLKSRLVGSSSTPIVSTFGSQRKTEPKLDHLHYPSRSNKITYCAGDVFDPAVWDQLKGRKFNLLFSDAFHNPDAVLFEWKQILDLELLDESGFTIVWDDLVSKEIRQVFNTITSDCMSKFGLSGRNAALMHVSGWVGDFEPPHPIGVISSQGFIT